MASLPLLPVVLFVTGYVGVLLVLAALALAVRYVLGPITTVLPKSD